VREALQHFLTAVVEVLPKLATAVVVLSLFWGLATLARRLVGAVATYIQDQSVRMLVTQLPYYFVWAAGFIVTLDAIGVNLQAAVTALGLGGVAIGFALKDILSNLVSGVLILAMRPFEIGDQIVVGDTEGTVEQIELRATEIRTYDGRLVLVPNGEVFTSRITNNTASPVRRASVDVYLGYKEVPGVVESPAPSMRLRELTEDGLHLEARFWADSHRTNLMNTASAARIAILRALREAGIQLHDPERRVVTIRPGTAGAAAAETFPEEFQHPNGTADRRTNRVSPPSTS
jgi:small-conductance mechanosensitive channel